MSKPQDPETSHASAGSLDSRHSSITGKTLNGFSTPALMADHGGGETTPDPQLAMASPSHEAKDPFDTTSPDWSYGGHLEATLQYEQGVRKMPPSAELSVLFSGLKVVGGGSGATYQSTVGKIFSTPVNGVRNLLSAKKDPEKYILHGIDGVVRAGEMLLVLGRPGSGCTTLLKNLAGFDKDYVRVEGSVKYNGVDLSIIKHQFRADVVYNSEVESHFPHLNVSQTLSFAVDARAPSSQRREKLKNEYVRLNTDVLATTFGLRHALQTKVGDEFVRGVSGGERKRVSIAEVLATRASVFYFDNATRGLDASTSLEFGETIRTSTSINHNTAIVAAYQAGENLTLLFDKVTILYLGRQIFFGSLADAKSHFTDLGFYCKPRQTTADFLTAITDHTGRRVQPGFEHTAPRSPDDFVRVWKESKYYAQLRTEIDQYKTEFDDVDFRLEKLKQLQSAQRDNQRAKGPYLAKLPEQFKVVMKRSLQRVLGDRAFLGSNFFASIFMSLIIGTAFLKTQGNTSGFFSKGGVIFFSVLFNALQTMAEVATAYAQRPIVEKQKGFAMYHPFIDSLSSLFVEFPFKFINILIFDVILYLMVGLKKEAHAFFFFFLVTYLSTLTMSAFFRTVAAATKDPETAGAITGVLVLVVSIYTGYVIPLPSMHPWFKWLRYINPLSYSFEALMVNEFHGRNGLCTSLVPSGAGYESVSINNQVCAVTGALPGEPFVSGDAYLSASFEYEYSHLWRNVSIVIGFLLFFIFTTALVTEYNDLEGSKGEFLVFRQGHEPAHIKTALAAGKAVDDIELGNDGEVLAGTKTNVSEFRGLVKSKDAFTWEHVNYDVTLRDGSIRRLLSDVTGYVKPGTLTALMGESGAGKTTLLNVLARRVDVGVVTGDMLVNGLPLNKSFQRRTGYVQQQDLHTSQSTVREALAFSARLRQTSDVPMAEKLEYVQTVIEMLEMEDYAEAIIGVPGNGLNVEQRKRTTIGLELVAKPALLLFLDEPTSGLDSQSAWSIVRLLRKLANSGQAILCTIHQPSSVLFEQFDRLLLLRKGGRTVYFGNIGQNSQDVIDYFERNGAFKCASQDNPAEYILQVIGAGATAKVDRDWAAIWDSTLDGREAIAQTQALKAEYKEIAGETEDDEEFDFAFAAPWLTQYKAVQYRMFQIYWRNPTYIMGKVILNVVAGLFIGFTFYKEDYSLQGLQNRLFAAFMSVILAMPGMNLLQPQWEHLSSLYSVREKPSKIYHWSAFVLSNIIAEIPYNFVTGTLFFVSWYSAIGFWKPFSGSDRNNRGIYEWLFYMLFQMWFSTFGQAIAAISPNAQVASTFTTLFGSFVIFFNGVLQPLRALPHFWHWMYYLSPFTYLIGGLVGNVVSGVDVVCAQKERSIFNPPSGETCLQYAGAFAQHAGKLLNPNATSNCEYCRFGVGDQYLETLNIEFSQRWRNFGIFAAYVIFNASCTFIFFYITKVANVSVPKLVKPSRLGKKPRSEKITTSSDTEAQSS